MDLGNHCLSAEFPEFKETIHTMKMASPHFRRLMEDYTQVSKELHRYEQQVEVASDHYIEALKKERLRLKDSLFQMLKMVKDLDSKTG